MAADNSACPRKTSTPGTRCTLFFPFPESMKRKEGIENDNDISTLQVVYWLWIHL